MEQQWATQTNILKTSCYRLGGNATGKIFELAEDAGVGCWSVDVIGHKRTQGSKGEKRISTTDGHDLLH
jgi:hypothetical protein